MNLSAPFKINKIKKQSEIKKILSEGRKVYTKYGIFFLLQEIELSETFYAVLLKKNIGNAVLRNNKKRLTKEYLRKNISKFKNYNRIIFLYNHDGDEKYSSLENEFNLKLKKI